LLLGAARNNCTSKPDELLMVGDSSADLLAARAAGCPVVLVGWGYGAHALPEGIEPWHVESPLQLLREMLSRQAEAGIATGMAEDFGFPARTAPRKKPEDIMPTGGRSTLIQFLIEERRRHPDATGDLNGLIADVALACKAISRKVAFGSLADVLGDHDAEESGAAPHQRTGRAAEDARRAEQQHLPARQRMGRSRGGHGVGRAGATSTCFRSSYPRGKYLLAFDPLDGSSNIDVNVSVGSIFSIMRAVTPGEDAATADFLQPGTQQVCAGYAIYGPSTMLVLTLGNGTHAFTLDPVLGEWVLSHPDLKVPRSTREFAINASNSRFWEPAVRRYVDECLAGAVPGRAAPISTCAGSRRWWPKRTAY
jgi:hypothetical protein